MKTKHRILFQNACKLVDIPGGSVDLVITSPPYPMIEMWDAVFCGQNPAVSARLRKSDGAGAFEQMHQVLDGVWDESFRVLKDGGLACINIGDATRTLDGRFCLYQNHSRIMRRMLELGFHSLPCIIWRKQTNAPNKFMGSGMLPPSAYVTLEHEYLLILRKGSNRKFKSEAAKTLRRESAFFWEERNVWFSDVWMDLKGVSQNLFEDSIRSRSGAFPFELAYRLINMFSIKGDTLLDPFLGIGTTLYAAMATGRNCIGVEIDETLNGAIRSKIDTIVPYANARIQTRIQRHLEFVEQYREAKGGFKHLNHPYGFPVVTRQETDLLFNPLSTLWVRDSKNFEVDYADAPQPEFMGDWNAYRAGGNREAKKSYKRPAQLKLME